MEINYQKLFLHTFKNKNVLVTGHTGFKGAWLVQWLHLLQANVKGYALKPDAKSLYNEIGVSKICESIYGDIRDKKKFEKEILKFEPDFIFHLAAQPLVRYSYENPIETFETNVIGTANLLETIKKMKKACTVVVVTTDKVYENIEKSYAYKETDKLGGYDPYSASKAASEIVVNSYKQSFFNEKDFAKHKKNIATARAGNVIGGGDYSKDRIVPDIIKACLNNKVVEIRNPMAVRPFQHVVEPLSGYLLLAALLQKKKITGNTSFNFGPNTKDVITVETLVKEAISVLKKGSYDVAVQKNQPHEATLLQLNIDKAKKELNWKPKLTGKQSIGWTMKWYMQKKENKKAYTIAQIKEYQQK
jgi:CDP-glucose 4,6-dehydratase